MATQKGLWSTKESITLKTFDIWTPGPGEVLIKNVAVASNPKDWKLPLYLGREGIEGNDVAGYVEAVGEGVTEFKKGDKVAAFTKMRSEPKFGAYQQYSVSPAVTTFALGSKTAFEDAATLPLAVSTAFIGLYKRLGLPPFTSPASPANQIPIVIYGASSSVGSFAVQLAKLSGLFVVGIAGAGSSYAKSVGADVVVDYRGKSSADIAAEVKSALGGRTLHHVYDAVTSPETFKLGVDLLRDAGGKVTSVLPAPEGVDIPSNVEASQTMCATAYGEDAEFSHDIFRRLGKLLEEGTFKPNRVKLIPGGLDGVQGGLTLLQANKVSAEKLVYRIGDTPGL